MRTGTGKVEQILDNAVTEAFDAISRAITSGHATHDQARDVMQTWGLGDAWSEYVGE